MDGREPTVEQLRTVFREQYQGTVWPTWLDSYNQADNGEPIDAALWWTAGKFVVYVRPALGQNDLLSVWKVILSATERHEREGPRPPWNIMDDGSHLMPIAHELRGAAGLEELRRQVPGIEEIE